MPRSRVFYSVDTLAKANAGIPSYGEGRLTYKDTLPLTTNTWTFDEVAKTLRIRADNTSASRFTKKLEKAVLGDIVTVSCEVYNISGAKAKIAVGNYEVSSKYTARWETIEMSHVITSGADRETVFIGTWVPDSAEFILKDIKIELQSQVEQQNVVDSVYGADSGYTKFADGTMVCFGKMEATGTATSQWGSWYYIEIPSVSFPEPFIEEPYVTITGGSRQSGLINSYYPNPTYNPLEVTPRVEYYKPVIDNQSKTYVMKYIAWGKYKM